ncbi:ArnT family glycosyltransferase [Pseudohoeflea coraliihabitans]|uniref:Uncharacterized protein n=1 Tax=Pseudohoeflea coraliihabitans TaxID=2860393 RepID=A0ABS6WLP0_9HYPH|nr:hypothetical protein [Pseudohoeflea sp. DP4N28-3]MBW3096879.1 hypothetical protein [Pseudohoeflea sp. DP4N28-3]
MSHYPRHDASTFRGAALLSALAALITISFISIGFYALFQKLDLREYFYVKDVYIYGSLISLATTFLYLIFPRLIFFLLLLAMILPLSLMGHLGEIIIILAQWAAIFAIGVCVDRRPIHCGMEFVRTLALGYALYSLLLIAAVHSGWFSPSVIAGIIALPILAAAAIFHAGKLTISLPAAPSVERSWLSAITVLLATMVIVTLSFFAAVPENGSDAIAAYRPMIAELMRTGSLTTDPEWISIGFISLPQIWAQAATAMLTGSEMAAKLWNYSLLCVSLIVLAVLSKSALERYGARGSGRGAWLLPGAVIASMPIVERVSLSAFPDLGALLSSVILIFWVFYLYEQVRLNRLLQPIDGVISGLLVALAVLTKLSLLPMLALCAVPLGIYLLIRCSPRNFLVFATIASVVFAGTALAYFGYVYSQTGNPLFPYYNEIFGSPYFGVFRSPHTGFFSYLLPWDMSVSTTAYNQGGGSKDGDLGLSFLLLFGAALTVLALQFARKGHHSPSAWITAAGFISAVYLLSYLQNNSRYVFVLAVIATPAFCVLVSARYGRLWEMAAVLTVTLNLALMPRFGHGGGMFLFAETQKSMHAEAYRSRLDRQRIADNLSSRYGPQGRYVALGNPIRPIGRLWATSWYYDQPAKALNEALKGGADGLENFLRSKNIDTVIFGSNSQQKMRRFSDQNFLNKLSELSAEIEHEGMFILFHLNNDVRFEEFLPLGEGVPVANRLEWMKRVEAGAFQWHFEYICRTPGAFFLERPLDHDPRPSARSYTTLCTGTPEILTTPLTSVNQPRRVLMDMRKSNADLRIINAGIWHRQPNE